jgi:HlyD family secretion protein
MRKDIFRQVSLDRLSSPEQLDQLLHVTTPRGWLALTALGGLLAVALVWGVVGSVPETVAGQGMLVKSGGVYQVVSEGGGRVMDVAINVGDLVREGQVVARIAQPDLQDQVQRAKRKLADMAARHAQAEGAARKDAALQSAYLGQQRGDLDRSYRDEDANLRRLQEKLTSQEQLVAQGLITRQTLMATQQQLDASTERIRGNRSELTQVSVKELTVRTGLEREAQARATERGEAGRDLARLERELKAASEVVSPYTGRILEVMAEQGGVINRSEPVVTMDPDGRSVKGLEVVVFVPSVQGKRLRPGMTIQVSPAMVKQEEYGVMLGRVTYISEFPATARGMLRTLKNEKLVSALAGADTPYEVHADLLLDPSTPSGYRWSSSRGPSLKVLSGTLCQAMIRVSQKRPLEMVIPMLRRYSGV